jgi:hypothetical protein
LISADFAVCDLTFARPSVYFEAGFAQRAVPVIYTVREDHLTRGQPDDCRVHFDLQMKPLITWLSGDDVTFAVRFEKRLRESVLRDLLRDREADEAVARARADYSNQPLVMRLIHARRVAIKALSDAGFDSWRPFSSRQPFRKEALLHGGVDNVRALRHSENTTFLATVSSFETLTKVSLRELAVRLSRDGTESRGDWIGREGTTSVETHHFVLSINKVPVSRIDSALPRAERVQNTSYIDVEDDDRPHFRHWHFLAPVRSEVDIQQMITRLMAVL